MTTKLITQQDHDKLRELEERREFLLYNIESNRTNPEMVREFKTKLAEVNEEIKTILQ